MRGGRYRIHPAAYDGNMYAYIERCVHVCKWCMFTYIYICIYMHARISLYICLCIHMSIYIYVNTCVHIYIYTHVYIYVDTCVYIYINACI